MPKIFKTGVKDLFLVNVFLAAAIMAAGFWAAQAPKAEAAYCAINCIGTGSIASIGTGSITNCDYDIDVWTYDNKICIIGDVTARMAVWSTENPCIDNAKTQACAHDMCPSFNYKNGAVCKIIGASGSFCGTVSTTPGIWDSTRKQCVECSGKLGKVWGSSSGLYTSPSLVCKEICGGDAASDGNATCAVAVVCTHQNPTVSIVGGSSQTKSAGDTAIYSISVTNQDTPALSCGSTNFNLSLSGCPSGWTCNIASSLSVQAGFSNSTSLTITSPASATPSTSNVVVTASGNSKSGNTTAIYVIAAGLNVSSNKNIINAGTPTSVRFTVKDGATSVRDAQVSFTGAANGSCNTNMAGYCDVTISPSSAGTINIEASYNGDSANTTITVNAAPCTDSTCGGVGGVQYCSGGFWLNCPSGGSCSGNGVCSAGGNCFGLGSICVNNSDCCSNDCVSGAIKRCAAVVPAPVTSIQPPAPVVTPCTPNKCNSAGQYCVGTTWTDCGSNQTCGAGGVCVSTCSGGGMYESPLGFGYCTLGEILAKSTNWILSLVSSIIVLVIIIGGLMYISSAGDEERLRASKNIIYYAIIGLGIILISAALINEVTNLLKG